MPCWCTRLVISLISTGATRFALSFLCTQRKLISTILFVLDKESGSLAFVHAVHVFDTSRELFISVAEPDRQSGSLNFTNDCGQTVDDLNTSCTHFHSTVVIYILFSMTLHLIHEKPQQSAKHQEVWRC